MLVKFEFLKVPKKLPVWLILFSLREITQFKVNYTNLNNYLNKYFYKHRKLLKKYFLTKEGKR